MGVKNANQEPKRFFGLHMLPGCAEYREAGKEPYRIFLNESTIKKMDPSFEGKPVYVQHVDEVDLGKLETEAAGLVVKSFYNNADGKHWVEFMIFSDLGHEAIRRGWRLSNAYVPKSFSSGGVWNGIDFDKEVTDGEYEHLALVPNPRYDESVILTPSQFKEYNEKKNLEIKRLANSKQGEHKVGKFNFFKKAVIENAADFENTLVTLPTSKVDMTIAQCIEGMDKVQNMQGYACNEHMVKVNDMEEMSVGDLMNKYNAMCEEKKANEEKAAAEVAKEKMNEEKEGDAQKDVDKEVEKDDKKKNEADEEARVKEAADKAKKEMQNEILKNAEKNAKGVATVIELDKTAAGRVRYGSSNPR